MTHRRKHKPGPTPEHLKADGVDWEDAMRHALGKQKPEKWENAKPGKKRDGRDSNPQQAD